MSAAVFADHRIVGVILRRRKMFYCARCSVCGWSGPEQDDIELASADAQAHNSFSHVEKASAIPAREKEKTTMNAFIETTALQIVGFIVTANADQIEHAIDTVGDKIVAAVNDSETKLDDAGADILASALRRLADRIADGVNGGAGEIQPG